MESQLTSTHKTVQKWFWLSHSSAAGPECKETMTSIPMNSSALSKKHTRSCLVSTHWCWDCQLTAHLGNSSSQDAAAQGKYPCGSVVHQLPPADESVCTSRKAGRVQTDYFYYYIFIITGFVRPSGAAQDSRKTPGRVKQQQETFRDAWACSRFALLVSEVDHRVIWVIPDRPTENQRYFQEQIKELHGFPWWQGAFEVNLEQNSQTLLTLILCFSILIPVFHASHTCRAVSEECMSCWGAGTKMQPGISTLPHEGALWYQHWTMHPNTNLAPCSVPKQNLVGIKICIIHLKHEEKSLAGLPLCRTQTELSVCTQLSWKFGVFNRAKRQNPHTWLHLLMTGWKS